MRQIIVTIEDGQEVEISTVGNVSTFDVFGAAETLRLLAEEEERAKIKFLMDQRNEMAKPTGRSCTCAHY